MANKKKSGLQTPPGQSPGSRPASPKGMQTLAAPPPSLPAGVELDTRELDMENPFANLVHGTTYRIRMDLVEPNDYNPFEMEDEQFNLLTENIDEVDFLDPILVTSNLEKGKFIIIDGEHRYLAMRVRDAEKISGVYAHPDRIPEARQKFQTLRLNRIRNRLNQKKFNALVQDLMESGEYTYEQLAREMAFADEDEFMQLIENARESLPDDETRRELDKAVARDEIKTVDDLAKVLQRIFSTHGNSLPFHYLVIDHFGKDSLWVRVKERTAYQKVLKVAQDCQAAGVTFDSVLTTLLGLLNVPAFVKKYGDKLEGPDPEPYDEMLSVEGSIDE